MSQKSDIYFQGRVYTGYTNPFMLRAFVGSEEISSIEVISEHPFTDWQDITGKYELHYQVNDGIGWVNVDEKTYFMAKEKNIDCRIAAIPTLVDPIFESMVAEAGWVREKPAADHEFVMVTAHENTLRSGIKYYNYRIWEVKKIEGPEEQWYYGLCDGEGEEWGPYEDLAADLYKII